jgi:uncharacterized membrane protein YraQ (UPF0718 family)
MLAAPALHPAALALTFALFPASMAWARLGLALALVLGVGVVAGRASASPGGLAGCPVDEPSPSVGGLFRGFAAALRDASRRSLPAILLGVLVSAALVGWIPIRSLASAGSGGSITVAIALLAVFVALPTFAEIPLALGLLHAGAPEGAALAVLVAGPAINLPSLLAVRSLSSWRVAAASGAAVFALAAGGGLLL